VGLVEDAAAERPAGDYLAVRIRERRARRLRLLTGWLSALITSSPDETPDVHGGAGVAIEVYRLPQGEALTRMDYDGWARYLAGQHLDALEHRLATESLAYFCESLGIEIDAALGRGGGQ